MAPILPSHDERRAAPQSVLRVIRILETLAVADGPVGLAELSRRLGTPKTSAIALLRGLEEQGLVATVDGAWSLGAGAFGLGSALVAARRRLATPDLLRESLRRLAEASGETALHAVPDQDGQTITYVDIVESRASVRFSVKVGDRRPLYATAAGRALLAARDEAAVAAYFAALQAVPLTGRTQTDPAALASAVTQARADGVAQTVDQAADGVTGTAAVVRDADGMVLGALVVAAPTSRWQATAPGSLAPGGDPAKLRAMVREEAARLSRGLGFRGA